MSCLVVHKPVALGYPIWILHRHVHASVWPVLHGEVAVGIITFEILYSIPVGAGREKINRYQRIEILALSYHVLLLDVGEHVVEVKGHLVVEQRGGIANGQVVAVIIVVVDNASGCHAASRKISEVFLVSCRKRNRL